MQGFTFLRKSCIFVHMADLKEDEKKNGSDNVAAKTSSSARIKKMRAWLGGCVPTAPEVFTEEDEALYYGEGHSGWNR